ncbi:MAG: phenylacetate--CoA ligase [Pseudomonadota bacterium]
MYWQPEIETIAPENLRALQLTRLRASVTQAAKSPFYAQRFADLRLTPADVRCLDDLKHLPLTGKDDLRGAYPWGMLAVERDEVVRLHASSGTTGTPTAVLHTASDLDGWTELVARSLHMAGARKSDVFQNLVGYGLFTGGLGLHYGAERLGSLVVPSGTGNSRRQVALMRQLGTTVIHLIPSYAMRLLETFAELDLDPRKDSALRLAVIGAEPHSEDLRRRIEAGFGVQAINSYGLSEMNGPGVAMECPHQNGLHIWEDAYLLEVLDPLRLTPVAEGQQGELVITTLNRAGMPLIRYRTRDLAALLPGPCPCGRSHRRLGRIAGRSDDMFIVKGVNIYPMQVEATLMGFKEVGNTYLIHLTRRDNADVMTVRAEVTEHARTLAAEDMGRLKKRLAAALKAELLVSSSVELVAPGSLPRAEGKAQRVLDERQG